MVWANVGKCGQPKFPGSGRGGQKSYPFRGAFAHPGPAINDEGKNFPSSVSR
jgi:hypothetical protein